MIFKNDWNTTETRDIKGRNIAEEILKSRKICNIDKYLYPKIMDLYDPFLFRQMNKAVDRIIDALDNMEGVVVYGDYDTDGITATAILYRFLLSLGVNVQYFIPDRKKDGYGLNSDVLEDILDEDISLLITVDCGITSLHQVEFVNEIGIDCIITDHHVPESQLPDAFAVICPEEENSGYPFKQLCGAGVALKLVQALCVRLDRGDEYLRYIDLAALGTIADLVPLTDENRVIAKIGMDILRNTDNPGLRSLIELSFPDSTKKLTSNQLAFNLIPKINSSGRMDNACYSIRLLLTDDKSECIDLSKKLNDFNIRRQNEQREITGKVIKCIEKEIDLNGLKVIVCADKEWDQGIIGIVSSHIVERYNRPVLLLQTGDDAISTGSGRSVEGFDLVSALAACDGKLIKYGGHRMAAGLSIHQNDIPDFSRMINDYAKNSGFEVKSKKSIKVDFSIDANDITIANVKTMSCLEPYGCENENPVFIVKNAILREKKHLGKDNNHLSMTFSKNNKYINCIAFNISSADKIIIEGHEYDIVFKMSLNTFNNNECVSCEILDMKFSNMEDRMTDSLISYAYTDKFINREHIARIFKEIVSNGTEYKYELRKIDEPGSFLIILDILQELCIIKYNNMNFEYVFINEINRSVKKDLDDSKTFLKAKANGTV
ncbi:MAG: single-stranded-DNA-specific exonuclease RecJ [Clostridia bacterium]